MAVTAKFQADFSDFDKGVKQADLQLVKLSTSAGTAGGAIGALGTRATRAVGPVNDVRGAFGQFDKLLASSGVNIGTNIGALSELAEASGKTSKDLGMVGTAGLAIGAGLAGWGIARATMEFFGLDAAVEKTWARLLGFADVAGETAAAKADVLARATANAKREITNYTEAIKINEDAHQKSRWLLEAPARLIAYEAQLKKTGGEVQSLTVKQKAQIDAGLALNISHADIAKGLSLTSDAVDTYVESLRAGAEAAKKATAEADALAKAAKTLQDHLFGGDVTAKAADYARELGDVRNVAKLTLDVQSEMNKVMAAAYDSLVRAGQGASAAAKEYLVLRDLTSDWVAINKTLAELPDPFAAQLQKRREKIRDVEVGILNLNAGLSASEQYWMHAGEIADAAMAKAKDAVDSVGVAAQASAQQMESGFSMAFAQVGNGAATMAERVTQLLSDAAINIRRAGMDAGGLGLGLAWQQQLHATQLSSNLPRFATGGPVTRDGPIFAHAGEYVLPKGGGGGGVTIHVGGISITVPAGGNAAAAGRETADAFLARLKAVGVRV